jgi:hypothetical protein
MIMRSPSIAILAFLVGCPADDDDGSSAAETHADHGSETHGTTDQGSETHATADHGSSETGPSSAVEAYCSCVFENCHEPYHMKWGEDEIAAQQACQMEAEGVPSNGAPIEMGNYLECRQHFCDVAANDPSVCPNALGDAVCI